MKGFAKIINFVIGALAILVVGLFIVFPAATHNSATLYKIVDSVEEVFYPLPIREEPFIPAPPDMDRMKKQGCVVDGFMSEYGRTSKIIKMVNRSECYYLHRAIETWLDAPDFDEIRDVQSKITKKDIIYGMFIAEAINTKESYHYPAEDRKFKFSDMCRKGTKNDWGEHTCKPSFKREEYRKYLRYITEQAMDAGVQVFMFGQIFYQDSMDDPIAPEIIQEMREYANFKGMEIVIGAQTNDIVDETYLREFDFIEGGVGLYTDGSIENNACFSRWWKKPGDWCWALLWHENYRSKSNNVFIHLDWSGVHGDDMSRFARLNQSRRAEVVRDLHGYFTSQDVGFIMPFFTALPENNGGCYGEKERYYSADSRYSCRDEDVINDVLKNAWE